DLIYSLIFNNRGGKMMTKISWSRLMFFTMLIFVLALAACGNGDSSEDGSTEDGSDAETEEGTEDGGDAGSGEGEAADGGEVYSYEDFPQAVSNDADPTGEGELVVGYGSDTPFEGTLNWAFYQGAPD